MRTDAAPSASTRRWPWLPSVAFWILILSALMVTHYVATEWASQTWSFFGDKPEKEVELDGLLLLALGCAGVGVVAGVISMVNHRWWRTLWCAALVAIASFLTAATWEDTSFKRAEDAREKASMVDDIPPPDCVCMSSGRPCECPGG